MGTDIARPEAKPRGDGMPGVVASARLARFSGRPGRPSLAIGQPDLRPFTESTRTARKSLTLVSVGPVTTWSPSARKRRWASLSASKALALRPRRFAPLEAIGAHDRARDLLGAVRAVGVASDGEDSEPAVELDRQRQQEFDVPPAAARSLDRHRRLSAGDEHAWRRRRLAMHGDLTRDAGHHLARPRAPRPRSRRRG